MNLKIYHHYQHYKKYISKDFHEWVANHLEEFLSSIFNQQFIHIFKKCFFNKTFAFLGRSKHQRSNVQVLLLGTYNMQLQGMKEVHPAFFQK